MGNDSIPHVLPATDDRAIDYAELVRAAAAGGEALDHLLTRTHDITRRYSELVCGHGADAEDTMQDALFKTYRYVRQIRDPRAFRTWLYQTVRNACLMSRRRRAGEPSQLDSLDARSTQAGVRDIAAPDPDPEALATQASIQSRVRRAIHALPQRYRAVVVLRDLAGLSTHEAAEALGISDDNVKTRLRRAHRLLRDALGSPPPAAGEASASPRGTDVNP